MDFKLKRRIILLMIIGLPFLSYSQKIKGSLIAGLNFAQLDGDEVYGFNKVGLNVGASAIVPIYNNFEFTLETLFSQKGSYQGKQVKDPVNGRTGEYNLKLYYLEIPVLITSTDKNIFSLGGGLSWARLVSASEEEHSGGEDFPPYIDKVGFKDNDLSILGDLRIRMYKNLHINLRYTYSMKKIRTRTFEPIDFEPFDRDQFNNLISLRLIYVFNESYVPATKKKEK